MTPAASPTSTNGSVVFARHLARHGRGVRYRLLGSAGQQLVDSSAMIEPIFGRGPRGDWRDQLRVFRRLLRPDRCAIHHYIFAPHPKAIRAIRAARIINRTPAIQTLPSMPPDSAPLEPLLFGERIVTLTEASALRLRSSGVEHVEVIRPCVPRPASTPTMSEARRRLRLSTPELSLGDEPAFLYAGDIETSDGAMTFVEAAAGVREVVPEARFILACRAKRVDHAHPRLKIQARILSLGLRDHVTLLGHVDDMPALQASMTAMTLSVDTLHAKVETPLVVLEAMAQGVPVIVSDLPALRELSGLGQGVAVVSRSAPEALASKLIEMAQIPSLRARMSRGAIKTVEDHFCPTKAARAYEAMYREVCGA